MAHKRSQIPISPEARKAIEAYANATGSTLPKVVSDLLDQVSPQMLEMSRAIEEARKVPAKGLRMAAEGIRKATADADQMLLEMEPKPRRNKRA